MSKPITRTTRAISWSVMTIAALATITACSTTQMAYNNADWFVTRVANDYLDLSPEQEEAWSPTLVRVLKRHRDEDLSHIVAFLINLERLVGKGLTQSKLECVSRQLEDLYRRTARLAVDAASPLLIGLSDAQIRHLEDRLRQRRVDFRRAFIEGSPSQRLDSRVERVRQRTVRWTGDLTPAQIALIREAVATWPDVAPDWDRYRTRKQRQFLALVRQRPSRATMDRFLIRWWVEYADRPPVLRQKHELLKQGLIRLLVSLDRSFSDEQRTRLIENIRDLRSDLQGLLPHPLDSSRIAYWGCPSLPRVSRQDPGMGGKPPGQLGQSTRKQGERIRE